MLARQILFGQEDGATGWALLDHASTLAGKRLWGRLGPPVI
jgi:hypothetical protein